jgi:hypothetical protein
MTQHYGQARSQKLLLASGWIELIEAALNRQCYFHKLSNQMVISKADMFLRRPPVTPSPSPRMRISSPAAICSLAREPDQQEPDQQEPDQAVTAPFFPPTIMEVTHGTLEEPIELTSSSSSWLLSMSSSVSGEFTDSSETQKMQQTGNDESEIQKRPCAKVQDDEGQLHIPKKKRIS